MIDPAEVFTTALTTDGWTVTNTDGTLTPSIESLQEIAREMRALTPKLPDKPAIEWTIEEVAAAWVNGLVQLLCAKCIPGGNVDIEMKCEKCGGRDIYVVQNGPFELDFLKVNVGFTVGSRDDP